MFGDINNRSGLREDYEWYHDCFLKDSSRLFVTQWGERLEGMQVPDMHALEISTLEDVNEGLRRLLVSMPI